MLRPRALVTIQETDDVDYQPDREELQVLWATLLWLIKPRGIVSEHCSVIWNAGELKLILHKSD